MRHKAPMKVAEIQLTYKSKTKAADRPLITCSEDAYKILAANWSEQIGLMEDFNILLLDRSSRVMGICPISRGGISETCVDLKIVFAAALKGRASSIILAHNHPSANLLPSQADIELTKRFKKAGAILQMSILDHLILSPEGGYFSFADECML